MRLTKQQRETLRMKFDGRCAYCGQLLGERWHADHFEAIQREIGYKGNLLGVRYPEKDTIDNMMPSCAPCNISKNQLTLEGWRMWLAGHVRSLNEHQSIYRLVKAYGLVVETAAPVVFYFERIPAGAST